MELLFNSEKYHSMVSVFFFFSSNMRGRGRGRGRERERERERLVCYKRVVTGERKEKEKEGWDPCEGIPEIEKRWGVAVLNSCNFASCDSHYHLLLSLCVRDRMRELL